MFVEWATRLAQADLASILTGVLTLSAFLVVTFQPSRAWRSLPLVNGKRPFELSYAKARKRYQADAKNLISAGFQKAG